MADDAVTPLDRVPADPIRSREGGRRLLDVVRVLQKLRGPDGCPWDREQTHRTLGRHLLEETHETLEAIDADDLDGLRDELGDVLLQVVFHAEIARQEGTWDVDDVAEGLVRKLIRRHPHVFGDTEVASAEEVLVNWERIKTEEEGASRGVEDEIPASLPALARAAKVQRRAAGSGFDWRTPGAALGSVRRELDELEAEVAGGESSAERAEEELGDLLFAGAAVARKLGVDPETALRGATRRFAERFERMRSEAADEGVSLDALDDEELLARFHSAR
ncbi:MAG TPA: nucleoside triphosphate pyrophosphohydrolase [Actinomycetota bacterium]|nr:nucleoside triphosphate pyrophosphohydrolase [Actinomycetota bacterium]